MTWARWVSTVRGLMPISRPICLLGMAGQKAGQHLPFPLRHLSNASPGPADLVVGLFSLTNVSRGRCDGGEQVIGREHRNRGAIQAAASKS